VDLFRAPAPVWDHPGLQMTDTDGRGRSAAGHRQAVEGRRL